MESNSNESKKRKTIVCGDNGYDHVRDDDDDEEEKIEKFFQLINNIRDARDRLMNGSNVYSSKGMTSNQIDDGKRSNKKKKKKKKVEEVEDQKAIADEIWRPSIQPQNLMEESSCQFKIPNVIFFGNAASQSTGGEKDNNSTKEGSLDLRLSL